MVEDPQKQTAKKGGESPIIIEPGLTLDSR